MWTNVGLTLQRVQLFLLHRHKFLVEKPKLELFESFRARLCSGFSMFSDSEIEEGIREVAKFVMI